MADLKNKSVLIVDDDPDVVTAITMALQDQGAKVFAAVDGSQAVDLHNKEQPDLVVLDMMLPKLLRLPRARAHQEGETQGLEAARDHDHRKPGLASQDLRRNAGR